MTLSCCCVYTQEATKFFRDVKEFVHSNTSEKRKNIELLVEWNFVELIHELWGRLQELIQNKDLPQYMRISLEVTTSNALICIAFSVVRA